MSSIDSMDRLAGVLRSTICLVDHYAGDTGELKTIAQLKKALKNTLHELHEMAAEAEALEEKFRATARRNDDF